MKKQTKTKPQRHDTSAQQLTSTITAQNLPTEKALLEVFPNNPLKQVAFEIRFQRNLKVVRDIGEVLDRLGDEFAFSGREEIHFPKEPVAQSFVFSHKNRILTVKVAEDRFAALVTRYESFEDFVGEVTKWTNRFCELFSIKNLKRIGLRYVNNMMFPSTNKDFTLERYVRPYVNLPRLGSGNVRQFSVELLTETSGCKLNIRNAFVGPLNSIGIEDATYILDLDAFTEKPTVLIDLGDTLPGLHHQAQLEFLTHITEEYKAIMRRKA